MDRSEQEKAALWDSMAEQFDRFELPTPEHDQILKELEARGAIREHTRVLDIGCAAGKYACYFASRGCEVTAVDISEKMLERAAANRQIFSLNRLTLVRADWETMPLSRIGGEKTFDLVFARCSPGVWTEAGFEKMLCAGRGWYLYGGSAGRTRMVKDQICRELGLNATAGGQEMRFAEIFTKLWGRGIRPEVFYTRNCVKTEMTVPAAVQYYEQVVQARLRQGSGENLTEEKKKQIAVLLGRIETNGCIREEIDSRVAVMLWNDRKEETEK